MDERLTEQIALFRYGVIAELVHLEPGTRGIYQRLMDKAEKTYQIPGTTRTRVAAQTMRDWLRKYREGGFDALKPVRRSDQGHSRRIPRDVVDVLVSIKEDHPPWSVRMVIDQARQLAEIPNSLPLPPSTVHRLLAVRGLMERRPAEPSNKDRRRFAFQEAGQLWMSDVMYGPCVFAEGRRKRQTYLIGFLDDATRVIPHAAFALSENVAAFLPVFKTALERRGIPERLYVDNGAAYRSHRLALITAQLGITLIHARPHQPSGKGKQERFFRTVRMQLLPQLTDTDLQSLQALNRRLWAYVEGEYHHAPHRGIDGLTPLECWARSAHSVRLVTPDLDLTELFLDQAKRRVHKDRTVSLNGRLYEVDATLVGTTVTLRFDPDQPQRPIRVLLDGKSFPDAHPVDAYANCFVRRHRPSDNLEVSEPHSASTSALRLSELRRRIQQRKDNE